MKTLLFTISVLFALTTFATDPEAIAICNDRNAGVVTNLRLYHVQDDHYRMVLLLGVRRPKQFEMKSTDSKMIFVSTDGKLEINISGGEMESKFIYEGEVYPMSCAK